MKIGNYTLKNKVIVAPLAGISNAAFRKIAAEFGAGLIYTEMTSDKGILHGNKKTMDMLKIESDEGAVSLQLFGADPEEMREATKVVNTESDAVFVDINIGCPVPKVVKGNGGASLMKDEDLAYTIVKAMVEASDKPVTAKIRSGWDDARINAVSLSKRLEEAGVSAIAVHGRTRTQMYRGKANLDIIKAVKEAVNIPVIGNGDIVTPEDALHMLSYTKCDAVMIGRGLLGNPWLIKQTVDYLETGTYQKEIELSERFDVIRKHIDYLADLKGKKVAMLEMRSHVPWYIKGLPHATYVKRAVAQTKTLEGLYSIIDQYEAQLKDERQLG